jgi:hypothetical protein
MAARRDFGDHPKLQPQKKPPMVTQEEIDLLIGFEEVIRQRKGVYQRLYSHTLARLRAGAAVEKGTHTLKVGPGGQYLVLDGVARTEFVPLPPGRAQ